MILNYWHKEMPFKYPFTISNGRTKTFQPTLIVSLSIGNFIGFGEAPAISYYNITVDQMIADLDSKRSMVEKFALTDPERYWHYLHHLFPNNPFLVCALDMAAWDLFGKMKGKLLYEMWGCKWDNDVLCDYTIGIDTIDKMVEKMNENNWPIYKIKLGTHQDIEIIEALRDNTSAPFRIDANAGWTFEEALDKIPKLADLGVEMIEQPLDKNDWDGMKVLFEESPLPLYADESCVFEKDVLKCQHHFHGINIKLTKCSGPTVARRMITEARQLGLKVMMGSMNETSIGSAAIANFLPLIDLVDMDGPLLLKEDIASGINYQDGRVQLMGSAGLGIQVYL